MRLLPCLQLMRLDTNIKCIVHATLTIIINKEMGVVLGVVTRNGCGLNELKVYLKFILQSWQL